MIQTDLVDIQSDAVPDTMNTTESVQQKPKDLNNSAKGHLKLKTIMPTLKHMSKILMLESKTWKINVAY